MDHFSCFGLAPGFDIDLAALETEYRERQRQFHPDLFVARGAAERRYSMEHATRLNEGYRILRDPLRRGEYLLRVTRFRSETPENVAPTDPSFLGAMMEWREELAEVDPGASDAPVVLERLRRRVEEASRGEVEGLAGCFSAWFSGGDRNNLEMAGQGIDRLRYFNRFLEEVDRREETILAR
ncbi:MAG: Fe-S protein assembly co-chaperone HscB [Magnetococcales bacterium]|nr:Fe-S protein assembly co-chaperone HscB [Magnetococcales bacterium]